MGRIAEIVKRPLRVMDPVSSYSKAQRNGFFVSSLPRER
jgi:hypothetical protein